MKYPQSILVLLLIPFLNSGCLMIEPWRYDCVSYSKNQKECKFETIGTISFEKKDGKILAVLHSIGKQPSSSFYWPKNAVPYQSVDTKRNYRFHYLESVIHVDATSRDWIDTTLIKIVDGDQILHDKSICEVHGVAMQRQIEEGVSAIDYPDHYFKGELARHFPNDGKAYLFCGSGLSNMTWKCNACYKISEKWRVKNGIK